MDESARTLCEEALYSATSGLGLEISQRQCEKLWMHFTLAIEANRHFNLTRVTDPVEFAAKLHVDSLAVLAWHARTGIDAKTVLDIGTGAGIPAIPLAVAAPDWSVTAIDGTGKKARFVADACRSLGLTNLRVEHARSEQWDISRRFDLVAFKAIGSIALCLKLALPLIARGGRAVIFKTGDPPEDEIRDGLAAAKRRGFDAPEVFRYELPCGDAVLSRSLRIFRHFGN